MMKRFKDVFKSEAGFTLIELLVVIAVLGILAGLAIPRLTGVKDKAKDAGIASFAGAVKTGMEMYYVENDAYPDMSGWTNDDISDLQSTLSTVGSGDTMTEYYISNITYTDNSGDTSKYLITFTGESGNTYYLGENGYSNTNTGDEASSL